MTKVFNRLNIAAVTQEVFDSWDTKRQKEYLDQHPNSKFVKQNGNNGQSNIDPKKAIDKKPFKGYDESKRDEYIKEIDKIRENNEDPKNLSDEAVSFIIDNYEFSFMLENYPLSNEQQEYLAKHKPNYLLGRDDITDEALQQIADKYPKLFNTKFDNNPKYKDILKKSPKAQKYLENERKREEDKEVKRKEREARDLEIKKIKDAYKAPYLQKQQEKAEEKRKRQEARRTPEFKKFNDEIEKSNEPLSLLESEALQIEKTPSGNYHLWCRYYDEYDHTPFSPASNKVFATPEDAVNALAKLYVKIKPKWWIEEIKSKAKEQGNTGGKLLIDAINKYQAKEEY